MSLTRTQVIEHVRTLADATNATTDFPALFVLLCAARAFDREWAALLDAVPYYRVATRTHTATSTDATNGGVPLSALDSGSGASKQRTYRVRQVLRGQDPLGAVP